MRGNLKAIDFPEEGELDVVTMERLERRLTEESSAIRLEVAQVRGEVRSDIRDLRAEMIDRQASMLRWLLGFFVAQTAALGALLAAIR